ncbi:MAG: hypothetical protein ACLP9K_05195 [Nitrososphaerales archaeon]
MKRRNIAIGIAIVAAIAVFSLPLVPVKVTPYCVRCPGGLFIEEQGYSSVGLYFSGYGGIYLSSLPNYFPTYVGYCVVYGTSSSTSCGAGIGLLKSV